MRYLLYIGFLFLLTQCSISKLPCPCDATDRILVDNVEMSIRTEIWRNLMPSFDDNSSNGMNIKAELFSLDECKLPEGMTIKFYAIRPSDESFDGFQDEFEQVTLNTNETVVELLAQTDKTWEPGTLVDIAVLFETSSGEKYFLKNDQVKVEAVY